VACGLGAGESLDQGGVAGTGADDELPHPGPEAAVHHIKRCFP
jgi:MOSC domain-containing protein YiiM